MASQLVQRALKGEESALVLLTEQFQIGTISVEALGDISAVPLGSNKYADYLKACLYTWGAKIGEFNVQENKYQAAEICKRLMRDGKFPWANNLMYMISPGYENYQKYILPILDSDNPLVISNYADNELMDINRIDLITRVYPRLSSYYQFQINTGIRQLVNDRSSDFKNFWKDIYHFYKKTNQSEAAENFLVLAARNNILGARMKLHKRFSTKASADYFCSGYLSTLAVINRKLASIFKAINQQYPEKVEEIVDTSEKLFPLLVGLKDVIKQDVSKVDPASAEYKKYQLYLDFYGLINMIDYINTRQDEWELFKNYIRHHNGILTKKIENDIAKVDTRFEEFTLLTKSLLDKMKSVAASKFNIGLFSQAELDRIHLRLLLESFASILARSRSQTEKVEEVKPKTSPAMIV